MNLDAYLPLAISLGLGLLVGLQREWKESDVAGIRTFPLISMWGTLSTLISHGQVGWLTATGLLSVTLLLVLANLLKWRAHQTSPGMTTEVAAVLMYSVGAALGAGFIGPAIVTAGTAAVLLQWKRPLHLFVERIGEKDLRGLFQLVLIALVILPMLPDETYGPYDVLNPYRIWRMVVLIVGISMLAYLAYRWLGSGVGTLLGGIFGGLISSTATTVSYARQTYNHPEATTMAALVIMIASTIVNVRVLFEIGLVAPRLLPMAILPITAAMTLMAMECALLYLTLRKGSVELPDHDNPAQLKAAIVFGALYAVILFVIAAVKDHFGDQALYVVAAISGLTDVDAITLSTAKLFNDGRVEANVAWRVVMVAITSNLVFKTCAVGVLGSRRLLTYIVVLFGIAMLGSICLLLFWPDVPLPMRWLQAFSAG